MDFPHSIKGCVPRVLTKTWCEDWQGRSPKLWSEMQFQTESCMSFCNIACSNVPPLLYMWVSFVSDVWLQKFCPSRCCVLFQLMVEKVIITCLKTFYKLVSFSCCCRWRLLVEVGELGWCRRWVGGGSRYTTVEMTDHTVWIQGQNEGPYGRTRDSEGREGMSEQCKVCTVLT
jgi:hypothetical protein